MYSIKHVQHVQYVHVSEHLQQSSNPTPHPHKTVILREMAHFFFSSSPPITFYFLAANKNTQSPLK